MGNPATDDASTALSWGVDGITTRDEFLSTVQHLLRLLIPSDAVSWNSVNKANGTAEVFGYELARNAQAAELLAVIADHPMVNSYVRPSAKHGYVPRRMSDIVSRTDLRRTRAYAELMKPFGAEYQLTILTSRPSSVAGGSWSLTRKTSDFSETERERAQALQSALATIDRCWFARHETGNTHVVDDLGLTPRQIEVLRLIAAGMTANAAARVLRISVRTVGKHLENAYATLGCHDRLLVVNRLRAAGILPPSLG